MWCGVLGQLHTHTCVESQPDVLLQPTPNHGLHLVCYRAGQDCCLALPCNQPGSLPLPQATTHQHILQNGNAIKAQQAQQLAQYKQNAFTDPTLKYLNESLAQRLKGLQPNITAVRSCLLHLKAAIGCLSCAW